MVVFGVGVAGAQKLMHDVFSALKGNWRNHSDLGLRFRSYHARINKELVFVHNLRKLDGRHRILFYVLQKVINIRQMSQ